MILGSWLSASAAIQLLADHLWQSTLFAVAAALLTLACRSSRAEVRHRLWLAASLKFLVPFAWLVAVGRQLGWLSSSRPASGVTFIIETVGQPFSPPAFDLAAPAQAPAAAGPALAALIPAVLVGIWIVGAAAVVLLWWVKWRRVASAVRTASPVREGRELDALRRLERTYGLGRPIALVAFDTTLEPGVFGIRRPVLVWPRGMSSRLDDAQIETIVAHELCHLRRRDNLAAAIHMIVEALFWFHPLVWWLGARLVDERERACDEGVVALGGEPQIYAESILKTCRFCVESPLACVAGVTGSDLSKRIERIMTGQAVRELTLWRRLVLVTAGVAAVAGPVAAGALSAAPRLPVPAPATDARHEAGVRPLMPRQLRTAPWARWLTPESGTARLDRAIEDLRGRAQSIRAQQAPPQSPAADGDRPAFEVASVKPSKSGDMFIMLGMRPGGRFTATNVPLRQLISIAYQVQNFQLEGGPAWIASDRFDINAKADRDLPPLPPPNPGGPPGPMQVMLQGLLADRFKLAVHRERKEMSIYALVPARSDGKLGPQLRPSTLDCAALMASRGRGGAPPPGPPPGPPPPGERPQCGMRMGPGTLAGGGLPIAQLATALSPLLQRIIVDRTGLTGPYDLDLQWTPDQMPQGRGDPPPGAPPLPPIDPNGPSIFTAVQEQLGLKLDSTKGPVEVLVIDQVEQPSPD